MKKGRRKCPNCKIQLKKKQHCRIGERIWFCPRCKYQTKNYDTMIQKVIM